MKETEQTLLDQIKEQVAKDHEYSDFRQIFPDLQDFEHYSLIITEIAERYYQAKAKASCEATLKRYNDLLIERNKLKEEISQLKAEVLKEKFPEN